MDVNETSSLSAVLELDHPGNSGIEGVVFASSDVLARLEASSTLTDQDGATAHGRAAEGLDAKALGVAVPPVSRTALAFLVCHCLVLPSLSQPLLRSMESTRMAVKACRCPRVRR